MIVRPRRLAACTGLLEADSAAKSVFLRCFEDQTGAKRSVGCDGAMLREIAVGNAGTAIAHHETGESGVQVWAEYAGVLGRVHERRRVGRVPERTCLWSREPGNGGLRPWTRRSSERSPARVGVPPMKRVAHMNSLLRKPGRRGAKVVNESLWTAPGWRRSAGGED